MATVQQTVVRISPSFDIFTSPRTVFVSISPFFWHVNSSCYSFFEDFSWLIQKDLANIFKTTRHVGQKTKGTAFPWRHPTVPEVLIDRTIEPLGTDTSLLRTVFNIPKKFSYIFFKKTSVIRTTATKSWPQRVNSYKLNLFTALRWSGESGIPIRWICTGWIPSSLAGELSRVI